MVSSLGVVDICCVAQHMLAWPPHSFLLSKITLFHPNSHRSVPLMRAEFGACPRLSQQKLCPQDWSVSTLSLSLGIVQQEDCEFGACSNCCAQHNRQTAVRHQNAEQRQRK